MEHRTKWSQEDLVEAFAEYLRTSCGLSSGVSQGYPYYTRRFLRARYEDRIVDLSELAVTDVIGYFGEQVSRYKSPTIRGIAAALRSFLRFLHVNGLADARLVQAVPKVPFWRLSSLPRSLSEEELAAVLDSCDRSSGIGLRDYAMVQCMAGLGLRRGEVIRLSLDDIDWRSGVVQIRKAKGRHADLLPLTSPVGEAIATYLRNGRPSTEECRIFVCHQGRIGAPLAAEGAKSVIERIFGRAGIDSSRKGAHALRHTAATRMIQHGATLKEIADVLRHRSLNTTATYAKVDLPALFAVAMPWPEVRL